MHVYQEPFLFLHTASFCVELDKGIRQALKIAALVSLRSPISLAIPQIAHPSFFPNVSRIAIHTLVSFGFFRQICLSFDCDHKTALRIGAIASTLGLIVEQTTYFLERRRHLQIEANKQNNVNEPRDAAVKQEFLLKENLKRVEIVALAILAIAASRILDYPWKASATVGAIIGSMTFIDSFILSKWGKDYMTSSMVAIMISARISGALVGS